MSSASMMGGGQSYAAKREEENPPLASKNECVLSLFILTGIILTIA